MENTLVHEIELYPPETFKTILDHEVNRSHRYGDSLTLVELVVETDPVSAQNLHEAELSVINALNIHLRTVDIPSKNGSKFLILMPATGTQGARTACERIKKLLERQTNTPPSFQLHVFVGLAALPNDDSSVTGDQLAENTSQALQHARSNQFTSVVSFTDLLK